MSLISIGNKGPEITNTDYWESEYFDKGKLLFSLNAGCIRMLIPDAMLMMVSEIKTGKLVIMSRGPWPEANRPDGFEFIFEDNSETPYIIHVGLESWMGIIPAKTATGKGWRFSAWTKDDGKIYDVECWYRLVDRIPHMKPWV